MRDYYEAFAAQCMRLCLMDDYDEPAKVKAHNAAMDRLRKLQADMAETDCAETVARLLVHEDDRVKLNGAAFCVEYGICREEGIPVLRKLEEACSDGTIAFAAKMVLKTML